MFDSIWSNACSTIEQLIGFYVDSIVDSVEHPHSLKPSLDSVMIIRPYSVLSPRISKATRQGWSPSPTADVGSSLHDHIIQGNLRHPLHVQRQPQGTTHHGHGPVNAHRLGHRGHHPRATMSLQRPSTCMSTKLSLPTLQVQYI